MQIMQILWRLEMDYIGHPYYVSGNAILHALGQRLNRETSRSLHASHGVFVPGQFGAFPGEHSQSGARPHLGSGLPDVETYDDLFLQREPDHSWLLESRPRDALNTHDLRTHAGYPTFSYQTIMGRRKDQRRQQQTTRWYVHAYLHADDPTTLPLGEASLSGLQFGGKRNYGYGKTTLKDTQMIDFDELDYSRLEGTDAHLLRLVTPFVTASDHPGANDVGVPWWWAESRNELRFREERLLASGTVYRLETVDHGQVVRYLGDRPVETAQNGLTRVGSHSRFGFGEFRTIPIAEHERTQMEREDAD